MVNRHPIFIPSKGRAGKTKTDVLLAKVGIYPQFVVEPQESHAYLSAGHTVLILPENDRGITYSRNHILKVAREDKLEWFWMMDDDINEFGEVIKGKTKRADASVIEKAERVMMKHPASLYSMELRQFAWTSDELKRNRIAMQCVLFIVPRCKNINYDLNIHIREDYDLTFQAIFKGHGTLKTAKYYYGIADMKSQEGGMESFYNEEKERREVIKLCRKYPKLVEPVFKKNRHDVKINWRKFKL